MDQLHTLSEYLLSTINLDSEVVLLGNTIGQYMFALVLFVAGIVVFKLAQLTILGWLGRIAARTKTDLDDTFVKMVRSFSPPFYVFLAFWVALRVLNIVGFADSLVTAVLIAWLVYQVVIIAGILVEDVIFKKFAKDQDATTKSALHLLANLTKGAIWGLGIILMLSNLGIDVSSLLAGVGIGGIAIAFALQGILGDLFSSFSIYFDKPFKVGDFIITGDTLGTVKRIGVKSTRIQSLFGEEITLSNQDLTKAKIQNYKRMEERRITFSFGILYETPVEKLRAVPEMVKEIVNSVECTRFDRAHFKTFGDSSYDFEVVYYVLDPDYNLHMDIQQDINFKLVDRFQKEGIEFAYPTRTLHMIQG